MINHARTLLLNVNGDGYGGNPGDEYIPIDYARQELPTCLQQVRHLLFGLSPDRLMLNYRARQILALLHATELVQFVTDLDSRITYTVDDPRLFSVAFGITVTPDIGVTGQLSFIGEADLPDLSGKCLQQWQVTVLDAATIEVRRKTAPSADFISNYEIQNGLSTPVALPGCSMQFRFSEDPLGSWLVEARTRPAWDIGIVTANLRKLSELTFLDLFYIGRGKPEPWPTFYRLWQSHAELAFALGGLVLGMIYRTEEIRLGVL